MKELLNKIIDKGLGGRFILTVVGAIVFAYLSITKILPVDKVTEILLIIIYAYFTKKEDNTNGGAK